MARQEVSCEVVRSTESCANVMLSLCSAFPDFSPPVDVLRRKLTKLKRYRLTRVYSSFIVSFYN